MTNNVAGKMFKDDVVALEAEYCEAHNKAVTAKIIREYLASMDKASVREDEEEEEDRKKIGMSDPAYYHSLGKEH